MKEIGPQRPKSARKITLTLLESCLFDHEGFESRPSPQVGSTAQASKLMPKNDKLKRLKSTYRPRILSISTFFFTRKNLQCNFSMRNSRLDNDSIRFCSLHKMIARHHVPFLGLEIMMSVRRGTLRCLITGCLY